MIYLASLGGVALYVFYIWFGWSNQEDSGETKLSFKERLHLERQEIAVTIIGALLFMWQGEGVIDSVCDGVGATFGDKWSDLCTSMQVNLEELNYVIGGACFGSLGLLIVKLAKIKAKKKLSE